MKVQKTNQTINPFGGINFIFEDIKAQGILDIIDKELGTRPKQAQYSYSELFMNMWSVFFCGGDCAEDLNENLRGYLKTVPAFKVADADTILRVFKSLKTAREQVTSEQGKVYDINRNDLMNRLNINIMKKMSLLKEGEYYDFDYDNEVLKTEKYDAKKTYKMVEGYFPGMATISGMPVYFENRDGNMNVKTKQDELLGRCFKFLEDSGIRINRSRMDAGSYTREVVEVVAKHSKLFYIRANRCEALYSTMLQLQDWEHVEINHRKYEVCSIDYQPFTYGKDEQKKTYRLVIMREDVGDKQYDLITGDTMKYRCILTNDRESTCKNIITYYNQRGNEERAIDILNNDFGWSKMPFSFLEENTVFLMVMMICKNIYTWLIAKYSKVFNGLKANYRIKKFIFRFITVPVKWVKRGRQNIMNVFSSKPYELLRV